MEKLATYLNQRTLLSFVALAMIIGMADRFQEYPRKFLQAMSHSDQRPSQILSKEIDSDLDRRESLRLRALHRTLIVEISAAEKKGFDVSRLRPIADQALVLNTPSYRAAAFERLQSLRLAIPQSMESFRPASENEEDSPPLPPSRPSVRKRKGR